MEEHPEKKGEVYRNLSAPSAQAQAALARRRDEKPKKQKVLLGKNGMPLHPTRSIYYDAVYNPTGVPPPGMPYADKESEGEESDDSDEIPMPSAPRPDGFIGSEEEDSDLDDIPMPVGPPPSKAPAAHFPVTVQQPPKPASQPAPKEISEEDRKEAVASATISSEPQMRDLQKESAMLMPAQLMRKKK